MANCSLQKTLILLLSWLILLDDTLASRLRLSVFALVDDVFILNHTLRSLSLRVSHWNCLSRCLHLISQFLSVFVGDCGKICPWDFILVQKL